MPNVGNYDERARRDRSGRRDPDATIDDPDENPVVIGEVVDTLRGMTRRNADLFRIALGAGKPDRRWRDGSR